MFYANASIKKAAVGYRGAWAAFGIEFNFPVSHNWVSMSPVDFVLHKNADGSASVIVGNVDRVYGMEWTVELVPERAWNHALPVLDFLDSKTKYTVEIRDALGAVLIRQTEGEYEWTSESEIHLGPQPAYRTPEPEQRTCDDWIQLGKDLELNGKNLQALDIYEDRSSRHHVGVARNNINQEVTRLKESGVAI